MMKDVRISSVQLSVLIIGFIFGSTAIMSPAKDVGQDAWLAYIIAWAGGFILMGVYVYISILNPSNTLIEILKNTFGKFIGSVISVLYIWYFIHLAALVLRNFGEFMVTTGYINTPIIFIIMCFALIIAYALKCGLEVTARMSEILVPIVGIITIGMFLLLISLYDITVFKPFLEKGFSPVLESAFSVLTFPFGETVVFLMIFPHLNKEKNIVKSSYIALIIVGLIILSTILRDLMVLGTDMFTRIVFPPHVTAKFVLGADVEPAIDVNLLIGGGVKISVCMYAAVMGITQVFNLDDYKPFVLPITVFTIALSIWVYDSLFEMMQWASEIWPYYSIPFQILIPTIVLIISFMKKKRQKTK